jgi:signal transduction histidine kinase
VTEPPPFPRLVTLACHDLRTPLATVNGFAKTLVRAGKLDERDARFVGLIETAAEQMNDLLDLLGLAARIEAGRYDPALLEADTLELARSDDARIEAGGTGETIGTDEPAVRRSLEALAIAAIRHGGVERVAWAVAGRELVLAPVTDGAAAVVTGDEPKDLGALVARIAIERLGGSLALEGETLRVVL